MSARGQRIEFDVCYPHGNALADERTAVRTGRRVRDELEREGGEASLIQGYRKFIRNKDLEYKSQRIPRDDLGGPPGAPSDGRWLERERDL